MIFDELRPYADDPERDDLEAVAEVLEHERPVPRAGFRAELKAHISELDRSRPVAWRPKRLGLLVATYAGSGFCLLLIAAAGLGGTGPLG